MVVVVTESIDVGEIRSQNTMHLRTEVGRITDDDGNAYELSASAPTSVPLVRSEKTGKWFALGWKDMVRLAVAAGIDKPDKETSGKRVAKKRSKKPEKKHAKKVQTRTRRSSAKNRK